jgi:hypothetical protein
MLQNYLLYIISNYNFQNSKKENKITLEKSGEIFFEVVKMALCVKPKP